MIYSQGKHGIRKNVAFSAVLLSYTGMKRYVFSGL